MRITVLGTGIMGAAMARSLAREGHDVTVWNRTPERAEAVVAPGITAATSVAEAVSGADAVVTVLFDEAAVLAVSAELAAELGPEAVWIQVSTVGPDGMRRIAAAVPQIEGRLVDAPVLGTRQPAENGALVVLAAGPPAARAAAQPVFDAIGSKTVTVADEVGQASALKLVCNSWVGLVNTGVAQALGMASALGVEPSMFLEAVTGGPLDLPYAHVKAALMESREWDTPAFAVEGVVKDIGLMLEAVRAAGGMSDELLSTLLGYYERTAALGHGGADMAAVRAAFDA